MLTIAKAFLRSANDVSPCVINNYFLHACCVGAHFNENENRLERLRSHRILVKCYESDRSSAKEELLLMPRMAKRHWHFVKKAFVIVNTN